MIYYLGLIGIVAFSVTGVLAGKKGMDILSITLLGVITALGGGTLRDLIITPGHVFWTEDLVYLWVPTLASVITFFIVRYINHILKLLMFVDAFGLSLFTVLATEKTLALNFLEPIAVLMGVITGVAGGMLRDILTDRIPLILGKEFYATPALLGSIVFCVLESYLPEHELNRIYAVGIIFIIRAAAIQWGLYYPKWLLYGYKS